MRYMIGFAVGCALLASSSAAFAQNALSAAQSAANVQAISGSSIINNAPSRTRSRSDITVPAFAPGLAAAGLNSCAGSTSVGVGGTGFSFGAGTTYEMEECTRRQNAASLAGLGQNAAALEMLCQSPNMKNALNASGTLCPSQRYAYAQAEANRRGTFYAPEAEPVVYRRTRNGRRVRAAVAAQVSGSDSSIQQQAAAYGRVR